MATILSALLHPTRTGECAPWTVANTCAWAQCTTTTGPTNARFTKCFDRCKLGIDVNVTSGSATDHIELDIRWDTGPSGRLGYVNFPPATCGSDTYLTRTGGSEMLVDVWGAWEAGLWSGSLDIYVYGRCNTGSGGFVRAYTSNDASGASGAKGLYVTAAHNSDTASGVACGARTVLLGVVTVSEDGSISIDDPDAIMQTTITLVGNGVDDTAMNSFHDATDAHVGDEFWSSSPLTPSSCLDGTYGVSRSYTSGGGDEVIVWDMNALRNAGHFTSSIVFSLYVSLNVSLFIFGTRTVNVDHINRVGGTVTGGSFVIDLDANVDRILNLQTNLNPCTRTQPFDSGWRNVIKTLTVNADGSIS